MTIRGTLNFSIFYVLVEKRKPMTKLTLPKVLKSFIKFKRRYKKNKFQFE